MINVNGVISNASAPNPFGQVDGAGANRLVNAIEQARKDNVKAMVLRINSPGGTAAASAAIYDELMRTRRGDSD